MAGNTMPCYDVFLDINVSKYSRLAYAMDTWWTPDALLCSVGRKVTEKRNTTNCP